MNGPRFGETNLGALAGLVVGAIGGLFAIGVARAIALGNIAQLIGTPRLSFISFLISGAIGWFLGGQFGPRLAAAFKSPRAEMISGGVSGLIPPVAIAVWCWYIATH